MIEFGVFPVPNTADREVIMEQVRIADEGLDLIGVQDHPYQRRYMETMALVSWMTARTSRVTVFTDVASLPLRSPAVLAKQAATIDVLSDGRFQLGLGAGSFWEAIEAMGGQRLSPGEALSALSEALDVIQLMWSDERSVRYRGSQYQLAGVKPGPAPVRNTGVWLGVYGPRALRMLGEKADGWVPSISTMPLKVLAEKNQMIDRAATEAGRDPRSIRRVANVQGMITSTASEGDYRGPVEQWVDQLSMLHRDYQLDGFIFWPEADPVDQTSRFLEVAELTRSAVAT